MTTHSSTARTWAIGGLVFAAAMFITVGVWQVLVGIAALVEEEFFVVAPNYTYEIDLTAWGWIHLIVGAISVLIGFFLFTGAAWARAVGIMLAGLSAVANFFFLPYYPLWAIVIIAVDVFVIWALANAGPRRGAEDAGDAGTAGYQTGDPQAGHNGWPASSPPGAPAGRHTAST